MITPVIKFSDIKKDQNCLLGFDQAIISRYGDTVAFVVSPERMAELLMMENRAKELTHKIISDVAHKLSVDNLG